MEPNTTFPLLKLPPLCIQNVFLEIEIFDLINISFASRKCHWLMKTVRTPLKQLNVEVKKNHCDIVFLLDKFVPYGGWCIKLNNSKNGIQLTQFSGTPGIRKLAHETGIDISSRMKDYYIITEDPLLSLRIGIFYFLDLFRIPLGGLCFVSHGLTASKRLIDKEKEEEYELEKMESEEFKYMIENFKFTRDLILDKPVSPNFYCDPIHFKFNRMLIEKKSCGWITRDFLFKLEVGDIRLKCCDVSKLTVHDIEDFVDRWYQSDDKKFELLLVEWNKDPGQFDFSRFVAVKWVENKAQRSRYKLYTQTWKMDLLEGWDFIRRDGLMATVAPRVNALIFCVWHDRFPNTEGAQIC